MNINEIEYIASKDNEKIKRFSKLSMAKYRNAEKLFLAEGVKLSVEAADAGAARYVLVEESVIEKEEIRKVLDKCDDDVIKYRISEQAFSKISTENAPQGIITVADYLPMHFTQSECPPESLDGKRVIALDGVRDPGNLGTVIRSALAFGYDMILLGDCADIYNTKTVRASMGALFRTSITVACDLPAYLSSLAQRGRNIVGAALIDNCKVFGECDIRSDDVPVIGNEGHGISAPVMNSCTSFVKIPISPMSESLNAGVAASVIMWEYSKLNRMR